VSAASRGVRATVSGRWVARPAFAGHGWTAWSYGDIADFSKTSAVRLDRHRSRLRQARTGIGDGSRIRARRAPCLGRGHLRRSRASSPSDIGRMHRIRTRGCYHRVLSGPILGGTSTGRTWLRDPTGRPGREPRSPVRLGPGSIFANEPEGGMGPARRLRYAAGNFYINEKDPRVRWSGTALSAVPGPVR